MPLEQSRGPSRDRVVEERYFASNCDGGPFPAPQGSWARPDERNQFPEDHRPRHHIRRLRASKPGTNLFASFSSTLTLPTIICPGYATGLRRL